VTVASQICDATVPSLLLNERRPDVGIASIAT
jgi:hypothetical protein